MTIAILSIRTTRRDYTRRLRLLGEAYNPDAMGHTSASNPMLDAALAMCSRGWALVPIAPGTKQPHGAVLRSVYGHARITPLAQRRASAPEIRAWFDADPNCALGVIAGAPSGGIGFVDIDAPAACPSLVAALDSMGGPVIITHRGLRFVIRQREPIAARKIVASGQHVGEVITGYHATGRRVVQYVVVPPSVHPSGTPYRWERPETAIPEVGETDIQQMLGGGGLHMTPADAGVADPDGSAGAPTSDLHTTSVPSPSVDRSKYKRYTSTPNISCTCSSSSQTQNEGIPTGHGDPALALASATPRSGVVSASHLLRDQRFNDAALRLLGLDGCAARAFRCVLPGHAEAHPSATLVVTDEGVVLYHDWHRRDGCEWLLLPAVYAAVVSGEVRPLRGPELAVWTLRMAIDAGVISPAPVDAPECPEDVDETTKRVYAGFIRLLQCKWLIEPGAPTVFSWRFAAAWCGVGRGGAAQRRVQRAMAELLRRGLIRVAGQHGRMALFVPGSGTPQGEQQQRCRQERRQRRRQQQQRRQEQQQEREAQRPPSWAPAGPCPVCGGTVFWTTEADAPRPRWVCGHCLEPPDPNRVLWWAGVRLQSRMPRNGHRMP